jgi:hypothetical protein
MITIKKTGGINPNFCQERTFSGGTLTKGSGSHEDKSYGQNKMTEHRLFSLNETILHNNSPECKKNGALPVANACPYFPGRNVEFFRPNTPHSFY